MNLYDMSASQIWDAWKKQQLTVNQVVSWQEHHKIYFDERGNIK
jgi:hypothetical protein